MPATAPAFDRSGPVKRVYLRTACNHDLRAAMYHLAEKSRKTSPWAQAYYQVHRDKGQSHACALRCLGQRWTKIIWTILGTRTAHGAELHQRNQVKHGFWNVKLHTLKPAS